MRRGEKQPEDLDRPDGNDLQTNYRKHDVGTKELIFRLQDRGYHVTDWGIDMRDDDGGDGIIYDDKMDMKVFDGDDLVALIDVKTKGSPDYMGRFNERHYIHYHEHAETFDVPAFVVMFQVDYKSNTVHDEFVFHIDSEERYANIHSSTDSDAVSNFPDGNNAVLVPHKHRDDWTTMIEKIQQ